MSKWLMEKPAQANPPHPKLSDMQVMAPPLVLSSKAVNDMNIVWHKYEEQVNIFRTFELKKMVQRVQGSKVNSNILT